MLSSHLSTVQARHHAHTRELVYLSSICFCIHALQTSPYIQGLQHKLWHFDLFPDAAAWYKGLHAPIACQVWHAHTISSRYYACKTLKLKGATSHGSC